MNMSPSGYRYDHKHQIHLVSRSFFEPWIPWIVQKDQEVSPYDFAIVGLPSYPHKAAG